MVEAARKRGYKYVAITDHSKSLGVAGGLSDEDLMKHTDECRALDEKFSDIRVLAGTEVDIRQDGTLDYSDELLAKLDFVVASLHSGFKQDKASLTMRVVRAMQNPYVRVIGHPTGRLLGDRDPYELDLDEIMKEAVRTRTCLEVNSNFHRLDLNDTHCRKAREMEYASSSTPTLTITTICLIFRTVLQRRSEVGLRKPTCSTPNLSRRCLP